MVDMELRTALAEVFNQGASDNPITFLDMPAFDSAVIGMTYDNRLIYSQDGIIEVLMNERDMSYTDAFDYLAYYIVRALPSIPNAPIIMLDIYDVKEKYL